MRVILLSTFAVLLAASAQAQDDLPTLSLVPSEEYGAYVVGPEGLPVYAMLTSKEVGGDGLDPLASCKEPCLERWPVVTVEGEIKLGPNLDPSLVGTVDWQDTQVLTYGGHPLFRFHQDRAGEDPEGQGIYSFGGYWALLTRFGDAFKTGPMPDAEDLPDEDLFEPGAGEESEIPFPFTD